MKKETDTKIQNRKVRVFKADITKKKYYLTYLESHSYVLNVSVVSKSVFIFLISLLF